MEPGETQSYSASHQALNYVQISQNILKRFVAVAVIFLIYLSSVQYLYKFTASKGFDIYFAVSKAEDVVPPSLTEILENKGILGEEKPVSIISLFSKVHQNLRIWPQ